MGYRIKTVAALTGIPRSTLLAWERRYALIDPDRQGNGYREYSEMEVARLQAVKRLIDEGYKVSEALSLVEAPPPAVPDAATPGLRVAAAHPTLAVRWSTSPPPDLTLVRAAPTVAALVDEPAPSAEVFVADLAALGPDPARAVERAVAALGARAAVVEVAFAPRATVLRLLRQGVRVVSAAGGDEALVQAVREQAAWRRLAELPPPPLAGTEDVPGRRFSDTQLARLGALRTGVSCECPNHLARLAAQLAAFEAYSAACAAQSPDDAVLHAWLQTGTARARAAVEEMLARVCEQEGISAGSAG